MRFDILPTRPAKNLTVKNCCDSQDALDLAMSAGNEDVVRVLEEWIKNNAVHIL